MMRAGDTVQRIGDEFMDMRKGMSATVTKVLPDGRHVLLEEFQAPHSIAALTIIISCDAHSTMNTQDE